MTRLAAFSLAVALVGAVALPAVASEPEVVVGTECRVIAGQWRFVVTAENVGTVAATVTIQIDSWGDDTVVLGPGESDFWWQAGSGGPITFAVYVDGELALTGPYDVSLCQETPSSTTITPPETTTSSTTPPVATSTPPASSTTSSTSPSVSSSTSTLPPAPTTTAPTGSSTTPPELPETGIGAGVLALAATAMLALGAVAVRNGEEA